MNCYRTTRENHDCGEIERVKSHPGNYTSSINSVQRKTEDVGAIAAFAFQLKMDPTKHALFGPMKSRALERDNCDLRVAPR